MSLYDQPIPNLIGGVSQQPPQARYVNQLGECVNGVADPVEGLGKRPPFEYVAKLTDGIFEAPPAVFFIDRDQANRYIALVGDGDVRVFGLTDGVERVVAGDPGAYLTAPNPRRDFRSLTIADYTILLNRTVSTARLADASPTRPYEGIIFVRAGAYGRNYIVRVKIGGTTVNGSFSAPDGSVSSHAAQIDTLNIASALLISLNANKGTTGLTFTLSGSIIYVSHPTTDFELTTEDGQGGEALRGLKDNIQRFSDLPRTAPTGLVLRVAGDPTSDFDDYWVRFNGTVWEETLRPGTTTSWNPATLPLGLVRQPNDTFTLEQLPWVDRAAGDDDSNPFASFEGLPLSSILFYRNRLGFLADENMILSKAGDYFNFFRTTLTQLLDDDPIDTPASDVSGDNSPVTKLEHAVAFDKKLLLFAPNGQYLVEADGPLSPATARIDPVTAFAASAVARPVAAGRNVYFPFERDGASGMREMYVDGVAQTEDAVEVTAQCPTYLPPQIVSLSATTLENTLVALSDETPNAAYLYEFLWNGDSKVQSAWGRWEIEDSLSILSLFFVENIAYAVIQRSDGYHLERVRFRPNLTDLGLDYFTHLDHRVEGVAEYNGITDKTVVTLPYPASADVECFTLVAPSGQHAPGIQVPIVSRSGYTVTLDGNKTAWNLIFGVRYNFRFDPTRPYFRPPDKIDPVANTETEVRVRDFSLDYAKTGYFKATFTPRYRAPVVKSFAGKVLGATAASIPPLDDGTFRIKTPCKNVHWNLTIENDSIFPSNFLAASWRGLVESKSQRIG